MLEISAVIPCYNGEDFIETALDSIKAQTCPVQEIIVVDDGSRDNSIERIGDWCFRNPTVNLDIIRQPNCGVSVARNRGWNATNSPWVSFLDADDIWYPRHNEILIRTLADAHSDFIFCDAHRAQKNGDTEIPLSTFFEMAQITSLLSETGTTHSISSALHKRLLSGSFVPTCSNLIRKSALEAVGGFEEGRAYGEDRQAWLKLFALGPVSAARISIGRQLYHDMNATHSRHAVKELKARLGLLEELLEKAPTYRLGPDELEIVKHSLHATLADLRYSLSRAGIGNMLSEGEALKRYGASYSLKDFMRGVYCSLTPS